MIPNIGRFVPKHQSQEYLALYKEWSQLMDAIGCEDTESALNKLARMADAARTTKPNDLQTNHLIGKHIVGDAPHQSLQSFARDIAKNAIGDHLLMPADDLLSLKYVPQPQPIIQPVEPPKPSQEALTSQGWHGPFL